MNKKLLPAILACAICMIFCAGAAAQTYVPVPVTVSSEKVKLNGVQYYAHKVLERQTLYSIAKAYGVSEKEITDINPSLTEKGLQKGSIIYIPIVADTVSVPAEEADGKDTAADIPVAPQPQAYVLHTVKWLENLDDIAAKYGVSAEDIMAFNNLPSKKVSRKQVLKIPVAGAVPEEIDENLPDDGTEIPEETEPEDTVAFFTPRNKVDAALLLPFKAGSNASVSTMDFYAGVLLALKDLKESGTGVNLSVFDIAAGTPDRSIFSANDFIIGPTASADLSAVLSAAHGTGQIVSPLDQKAAGLAAGNPNFIQVPTPAEYQYEDMARWVREDFKGGDKVVLIAEKNGPRDIQEKISNVLSELYLPFNHLYYAISEGTTIAARLNEILDKEGENRIIVASENDLFVGDVMRNLGIMLGRNYRITVYAPSKVRNMDSVSEADMHKVDMHVSASYHADYSAPEVHKFVLQYRALYGTEPSQFAFQGYDTATCMISLCAKYGNSWKGMASRERFRLLHTDFLFRELPGGALVNTAVRRIVYRSDFTTELVK